MRNSKYLRKNRSLSEFYKLAHDIATEYAATSPVRARSILMEKYNVTESTYYYLLEFAITHYLVSDTVIQQMQEKTLANQSAHGNHGYSSNLKYAVLMEERKNYSAFSKKDITEIAKFFAEHPERSKEDIARMYGFHKSTVLDHLLLKACAECIVTDKLFEAIKKRSFETAADKERTERFFCEVAQRRATFKQSLKNEGVHF